MQVKLLRVLQDGVFERLEEPRLFVDVRIGCLNAHSGRRQNGREDQHRLNVFRSKLLPRERRDDIPLSRTIFLGLRTKNRKDVLGGFRGCQALSAYDWPVMFANSRTSWSEPSFSQRRAKFKEKTYRKAWPAAPRSAICLHSAGNPLEEVERLLIKETLRMTRETKAPPRGFWDRNPNDL